jgi:hypothetical protein
MAEETEEDGEQNGEKERQGQVKNPRHEPGKESNDLKRLQTSFL